MTAIVTILVFLLVVMIHELGHFTTAKMFGVRVLEFSVGMGPKLISKKHKETVYSLRALPLGGFCMLEGEDEEAYEKESINAQPAWKRFVVLAAGSFNNLVLAFILFSILFFKMGTYTTTIATVMPDLPAQQAGIMAGDKIVSVNGQAITSWEDMSLQIAQNKEESISFGVVRAGESKTIEVKPAFVPENKRYMIGIEPKVSHHLGGAFQKTANHMGYIVKQTFALFGRLFQFQDVSKEVAGPVGIIKMVGQATRYGVYAVVEIAALISMSLGIFNLLPFPALDGGRILFVLIEKIIRRPVNKTVEGYFHLAGFIILIGLTILITIKDITK